MGIFCGFQAAASKCSAKSCTDIFTKTDDAACKAYLPSCYFTDSNTCAATKTGACGDYTPKAPPVLTRILTEFLNSDKAASCNQ